MWVDEQALALWRAPPVANARGRPRLYADTAIECALVIEAVFHLSLRETLGFLGSVFRLMDLKLPLPDYATLGRRQSGLALHLDSRRSARPRQLVLDTSGLKVYAAGEWKPHLYSGQPGTRRMWRKLHLAVFETTKEVVAVALTPRRPHDGHGLPGLPGLLDVVTSPLAQMSAVKAYDSAACSEAIVARVAAPTIPPRWRSRASRLDDPPPGKAARDEVLRCIAAEGRYTWRGASGAAATEETESPLVTSNMTAQSRTGPHGDERAALPRQR